MSLGIVIADGEPVVRAGLRAWFNASDLTILGEAADGPEAIRLAAELAPQALLADLFLPIVSGLDCLAKLRESNLQTPVLIHASSSNPTHAARALAAGAAGMIPKSSSREAYAEALRTAVRGERLAPALASSNGRSAQALAAVPGAPALTSRELEVLHQLSFGLSNKEIAQALGISYETVKEHVQHILRKLGVSDRTQAAVWAVRNGIA